MTAMKLFERKNFLLVISFSKREYQSLFWGEQNAASYAFGIRGGAAFGHLLRWNHYMRLAGSFEVRDSR